jgi:hypothetical protein
MHVSEAEMSEALHVASAMAAGIALVHSAQIPPGRFQSPG